MKWLDTLPTTNGRIVWSMVMSTIVILTLLYIGVVLNRPVQEMIVYAILGYLAIWAGLDVTQFVKKRQTTIVSPPDVMASNTTSEMQVAVDPAPQAGVKPKSADVRKPLEQYAEKQRVALDHDTPEAS